jgi:holliday junction DNA helicase RuvA
MIAFLNGKWEFLSPALMYVDVQGVGYEVNISLHTYTLLQNKNEGKLFTHLQIKEDAHTLFGFAELAEKEIFLQLISVSGIGASTARMMLSSSNPEEITRAIVNGDTKKLESIKGIGKKTAERTILELRDKLAKNSLQTEPLLHTTNSSFAANKDALNALLSLGIARNVAENAINKAAAQLGNTDKVEDVIKKALQLV